MKRCDPFGQVDVCSGAESILADDACETAAAGARAARANSRRASFLRMVGPPWLGWLRGVRGSFSGECRERDERFPLQKRQTQRAKGGQQKE
jgi:hypothetical protein